MAWVFRAPLFPIPALWPKDALRSKGAVGLGRASGIDNMAVVWGWKVWSRGFLRHLAGFSFPVFR